MAKNSLDYYMQREPRDQRVIVLEELDFVWDKSELKKLRDLWNEGAPLEEISESLDRDGDEVFLALIHLARDKRSKIISKPITAKRMAI